jgi:hypothetical protein
MLTVAQRAVLDAVWKQLDARLSGHEARVLNIFRTMMRDQRAEVIGNIADANPGSSKALGDAVELLLFGTTDYVTRWTAPLLLVLDNVRELSAGNVFLDIGMELPIDLRPDAEQLRLLEQITARDIRKVSETTKEQLRKTLLEGFAKGEGTEGLIKRVRQTMDARGARLALIAEQEAGVALSMGTFDGFKQAGIEEHLWVTQRDSKVSSGPPDSKRAHNVLDGEKAGVGETFTNGLLFPRDPSGIDYEVIGCRCFNVPAGILPEF